MKPGVSKQNWLWGFFLFAVTVVAYLPVWRAGFIWDDDLFLLNNPLIREADGLARLWFSTEAPDYFPMTSTTLWFEWRLWGENALGYHLVNVLLHASSAVLWWRVLHKLNVPMAWLAAALFALHPVNVESVAWITERKNTLAMFFYVMSLLAYVHFEDTQRRNWYGLSLTMFLLALLSKTAVVMMPFVLLGIAWWRRGCIKRPDLVRSLPCFAIALILGLVTVWFQYNRAISTDVVREEGFLARMAAAGWAVWFYLCKAIMPLNLSFVYPRWPIDGGKLFSYVPAVAVILGLGLCWFQRRRWGKASLAAFGYFVIMLLPVLGFLNIYFMRYSLVADHWQYFAIIGPIALIAGGVARAADRFSGRAPVVARITGAGLLLLLGVLTWRQTGTYENLETLWARTAARNPGSAMVQNALGDTYLQQGRLDEAKVCFEKSLAIKPDDPLVQNNLAITLVRAGKPEEAVALLEKALRMEIHTGETSNNLAWLLATCPVDRIRNGRRAVELAHEADQLSGGDNPMFIDTLAAAYAEAGQFEEAVIEARRGIDMALLMNDRQMVATLEARVQLYATRSPFRDESLSAINPGTETK